MRCLMAAENPERAGHVCCARLLAAGPYCDRTLRWQGQYHLRRSVGQAARQYHLSQQVDQPRPQYHLRRSVTPETNSSLSDNLELTKLLPKITLKLSRPVPCA